MVEEITKAINEADNFIIATDRHKTLVKINDKAMAICLYMQLCDSLMTAYDIPEEMLIKYLREAAKNKDKLKRQVVNKDTAGNIFNPDEVKKELENIIKDLDNMLNILKDKKNK